MLVTELRGILLEERKRGRKPSCVILNEKDFEELLGDLSIKVDVFEPIILYGVHIIIDSQILRLTDRGEGAPVKGFTA